MYDPNVVKVSKVATWKASQVAGFFGVFSIFVLVMIFIPTRELGTVKNKARMAAIIEARKWPAGERKARANQLLALDASAFFDSEIDPFAKGVLEEIVESGEIPADPSLEKRPWSTFFVWLAIILIATWIVFSFVYQIQMYQFRRDWFRRMGRWQGKLMLALTTPAFLMALRGLKTYSRVPTYLTADDLKKIIQERYSIREEHPPMRRIKRMLSASGEKRYGIASELEKFTAVHAFGKKSLILYVWEFEPTPLPAWDKLKEYIVTWDEKAREYVVRMYVRYTDDSLVQNKRYGDVRIKKLRGPDGVFETVRGDALSNVDAIQRSDTLRVRLQNALRRPRLYDPDMPM